MVDDGEIVTDEQVGQAQPLLQAAATAMAVSVFRMDILPDFLARFAMCAEPNIRIAKLRCS